jgi:hypothetical protein
MQEALMKLICLACSATKSKAGGMMPAFERYDGPMWRTLRAALHETDAIPHVWFLSARYGFQLATMKIPDYEHRITSWPARITNEDGFERAVLAADAVLLAGGALYRDAMARTLGAIDYVTETDGKGIGFQRAQLRAWIEEHCR